MASSFIGSEDPFLMDSVPSSALDLSSDNVGSAAWRFDSWGIGAAPDNFDAALGASYERVLSPGQDSEDSITDQDEFPSPTPTSPTSDSALMFDDVTVDDDSELMQEESGAYSVGPDDASEDSSETAELDDSSVLLGGVPSSPVSASSPSSSVSQPAKRRGRPPRGNKQALVMQAAGVTSTSRKRRAESLVPETLLGTKKSKTAGSVPSLVDRLPSSITAVELQGMSSADFDSYLNMVAAKLSKAELEMAKQQRRRIKNRESASNSRVRKQDNLADLEAQVAELRHQNESLKQRSLAIESEHRAMARELEGYKRLVRQHLPAQYVPTFFNANGATNASNTTTTASSGDVIQVTARNGRSSRVLARDVASAALMCIVLFAMIWGSSTVIPGSVLRDAQLNVLNGGSRLAFPLPSPNAMAPVSSLSATAASASSSMAATRNGALITRRNQASHAKNSAIALAAVPNDATWLARVIQETQHPERALSSSGASSSSSSMEISSSSAAAISVEGSVAAASEMNTARTEAMLVSTEDVEKPNNDTLLNAHLGGTPLATSSSSASTSSSSSSSNNNNNSNNDVSTTYSPQWKQNTTYIKCESVQQVVPPVGAQPVLDPSSPLYVSLWLDPHSIAGGSASPISASTSKDPFNMDYLVQITCQIMNVEQLGLLASTSNRAITASSSSASALPTARALPVPTVLAQSSS